MSSAEHERALTGLLDRLQEVAQRDEKPSIQDLVEQIGSSSFPALMLMFALLAVSPASAVPGVTTLVAIAELLMAVEMLAGTKKLWLPNFVSSKRIERQTLQNAIDWLRRPLAFVQKHLRERLTHFVEPPWFYLPLFLVLSLTLFMPFMEIIPASGSIAGAAIAFFAAGLLCRDGLLICFSVGTTVVLASVIFTFVFAG